MAPARVDQLTGSLLGLALGDALGAVVEAHPPDDARRYVESWLQAGIVPPRGREAFPFGQVTDDTQMARELLQSIADAGRFDPARFATRLLNLVASGRLIGGGPAPINTARQLALGTPWHEAGMPAPYAGNGAAMRAGPLGILFGHDVKQLSRVAADQARVTHQDPRCAAGALAIAGATAIAARRERIRPVELLVELSGWVEPLDPGFATVIWDMTNWVHLPPDAAAGFLCEQGLEPQSAHGWHGISSFVTSSVCWSLYAFLQAPESYWEGICVAIAVGGDTDTMAAMTGSILGGRHGAAAVPAAFCEHLTDAGTWRADDLVALARACLERLA
jgi:ADP-ribosylglycohydrolase